MERRTSLRMRVDVPIAAFVDGHRHECRAVDLSPAGMVIERPRGLLGRPLAQLTPFEILLPNARPIRTRARPVWDRDRLSALKFVAMSDADRLVLAELLDRKARLREPLH
jgi:hypothetical protein